MLAKPFFTVSGLTLLSRVTGFVRDIVVAAAMGAGPLAEAFLVAFKLPNFFRRLFAEGAFNAAFVPLFSGALAAEGKEAAERFAEKALSVLLWSLVAFTIVMEMAMPWAMWMLAPGFAGDAEKFDLAVTLTRITFPYLLLISLVSLLGGVLNSVGRFAAVAAAPIWLNVCLVGALLLLTPMLETPAHALSWGVAMAGVAQLLWLIWACRRAGIRIGLVKPSLPPQVRILLRKMVPGIVGTGVVQINLWVDTLIATFIPGAIAYLYYADRLCQLPLSILGTAMGVVMLPALSRQIREGNVTQALHSQNRALELVLFLALPSATVLALIAGPLMSVLFERGAFTAGDARASALALAAFAFGLPAFVTIKVFSAGFFANGDTATPVRIAVIAMLTNIALNILFVLSFPRLGWMPHTGIALATSLSAWLNTGMLAVKLRARERLALDDTAKRRMRGTVLASLGMAAALLLLQNALLDWLADGASRMIAFSLLLAGGGGAFTLIAFLLKIYDIAELKRYFSRRPKQ